MSSASQKFFLNKEFEEHHMNRTSYFYKLLLEIKNTNTYSLISRNIYKDLSYYYKLFDNRVIKVNVNDVLTLGPNQVIDWFFYLHNNNVINNYVFLYSFYIFSYIVNLLGVKN
jgi:hypothetical protein